MDRAPQGIAVMGASWRWMWIVVCWMGLAGCGPQGTALPLDVSDLSPIQPQLDRLSPEDRQLVLDYLKRSNGDVLPARFADPDAPLTARTFAEAIQLQREFAKREAVEDTRIGALRAARDATLEPLRAVTAVDLVSREMLTQEEIYGAAVNAVDDRGRSVKSATRNASNERSLVVTYRLRNTSSRNIVGLAGVVEVVDRSGAVRDHIYIDRRDPVAAATGVDLRYGPGLMPGGVQDYLRTPMSELSVVWKPYEIRFEDGSELKGER